MSAQGKRQVWHCAYALVQAFTYRVLHQSSSYTRLIKVLLSRNRSRRLLTASMFFVRLECVSVDQTSIPGIRFFPFRPLYCRCMLLHVLLQDKSMVSALSELISTSASTRKIVASIILAVRLRLPTALRAVLCTAVFLAFSARA